MNYEWVAGTKKAILKVHLAFKHAKEYVSWKEQKHSKAVKFKIELLNY